jgi:hypothetical protein
VTVLSLLVLSDTKWKNSSTEDWICLLLRLFGQGYQHCGWLPSVNSRKCSVSSCGYVFMLELMPVTLMTLGTYFNHLDHCWASTIVWFILSFQSCCHSASSWYRCQCIAQLICWLPSEHVTAALTTLLWICAREWIHFKITADVLIIILVHATSPLFPVFQCHWLLYERLWSFIAAQLEVPLTNRRDLEQRVLVSSHSSG